MRSQPTNHQPPPQPQAMACFNKDIIFADVSADGVHAQTLYGEA